MWTRATSDHGPPPGIARGSSRSSGAAWSPWSSRQPGCRLPNPPPPRLRRTVLGRRDGYGRWLAEPRRRRPGSGGAARPSSRVVFGCRGRAGCMARNLVGAGRCGSCRHAAGCGPRAVLGRRGRVGRGLVEPRRRWPGFRQCRPSGPRVGSIVRGAGPCGVKSCRCRALRQLFPAYRPGVGRGGARSSGWRGGRGLVERRPRTPGSGGAARSGPQVVFGCRGARWSCGSKPRRLGGAAAAPGAPPGCGRGRCSLVSVAR